MKIKKYKIKKFNFSNRNWNKKNKNPEMIRKNPEKSRKIRKSKKILKILKIQKKIQKSFQKSFQNILRKNSKNLSFFLIDFSLTPAGVPFLLEQSLILLNKSRSQVLCSQCLSARPRG